jgi:hypothetical protein
MRWVGHVARMGEDNNGCKIFIGNPERKRSSKSSRHSWRIILNWILRK